MGVSAGTEIAGYRVTRAIGEGGMSVVYLAESLQDGGEAVLKILKEQLYENEDFRRRFLRESGYAASLDHPNVVPVLDAGETDETLYIAMEYIDGMDLYSRLEEGPVEPDVTITILAQVGAALDAAHAVGLVHRDVKPGNVLLAAASNDRRPRALLTDFGLSKHATKDSVALTGAGSFVGTVAYTAPEQMLQAEAGPAADVYSLGCLLFECLTGLPPFVGSEVEVMQAHIESTPPKLSKKRSPFPSQLDAVIKKALAKEPSERYESCSALVRAAAEALGVEKPFLSAGRAEAGRPLEFIVTLGNSAGSTIRVDHELMIGRGELGEGMLGDDLEISRRHARIFHDPQGGLTIEDLGSTNGTLVNDRQVTAPRTLRSGDEVQLGGTKLVVQPTHEPEASDFALRDVGTRPISRLSLLLDIDLASREAKLVFDEGSGSVRLVYEGGRWRLAA